eukprot:3171468-Amphidinium_carterae.1
MPCWRTPGLCHGQLPGPKMGRHAGRLALAAREPANILTAPRELHHESGVSLGKFEPIKEAWNTWQHGLAWRVFGLLETACIHQKILESGEVPFEIDNGYLQSHALLMVHLLGASGVDGGTSSKQCEESERQEISSDCWTIAHYLFAETLFSLVSFGRKPIKSGPHGKLCHLGS